MSSRTRRRAPRRAPRKGSRAKHRAAPASGNASDAERSDALPLFEAPRSLWKAGVEALSGGGGLVTYPQAALQGGLKKLESVFDQRVLDALARASMPAPEEIRQLQQRVAELETLVRRLVRRKSTD